MHLGTVRYRCLYKKKSERLTRLVQEVAVDERLHDVVTLVQDHRHQAEGFLYNHPPLHQFRNLLGLKGQYYKQG